MNSIQKTFNFEEGELILVDKPLEWTSFDVVGKIRNTINIKRLKVGHAGTLDPLATGLLIICTGKLTKQIDQFLAQEKEYTGVITLGATTPSYDLETSTNATFSLTDITEERIQEVTKLFKGEIEQVSPVFSALKVDGERAYLKARRGEEVSIKSRKVFISEFEITEITLPEVRFRIVCSKGTYIRSIANDFGKALNNGAYLSELRRTRSGDFNIENAWNLQALIMEIKKQKKQKFNQ